MEKFNTKKTNLKHRVEYQTIKTLLQNKQEIRINFSRSHAYHLLQLQQQNQTYNQVLAITTNPQPKDSLQQMHSSLSHHMAELQFSDHLSSPLDNSFQEVIRRQGNRLVSAGWGEQKPLLRNSIMSRTYRRKRHFQLSLRSNSCKQNELIEKEKSLNTVQMGETGSIDEKRGYGRISNLSKNPFSSSNFSSHLPIKHGFSAYLTTSPYHQQLQQSSHIAKYESFIQSQPAPYTSRRKRKSINNVIPLELDKFPEAVLLKQPESACGPWRNHHKDNNVKQQEDHHLQVL